MCVQDSGEIAGSWAKAGNYKKRWITVLGQRVRKCSENDGGGGGLVTKLCLILTIPWTVTAGLLCPWDFPGKNTGVGCISSSRGSSRPKNGTQVSCTADRFFTNWALREVLREWWEHVRKHQGSLRGSHGPNQGGFKHQNKGPLTKTEIHKCTLI